MNGLIINSAVAETPARPAYEPPAIRSLGTLAELTQGIVPITTDGLGPGSAL
jgi:hypothetical protein